MSDSNNYRHGLPPAVISEVILKQIDAAVPQMLRSDLTWSAKVPRGRHAATTTKEENIDDFLEAITGKQGFDQVALEAFSEDKAISLYLYIESPTTLEYDCPPESEADLATIAHSLQNIFREERHWSHWMPLAWFRSPRFHIGRQDIPLWRRLRWQLITENVIANVVSHFLFAGGGFGIGLLLGKFAI